MRFSKAVVKYRVAILIVALVLLAPAVLGMVNTRINYDMLDYLPEDMDTVIGQKLFPCSGFCNQTNLKDIGTVCNCESFFCILFH